MAAGAKPKGYPDFGEIRVSTLDITYRFDELGNRVHLFIRHPIEFVNQHDDGAFRPRDLLLKGAPLCFRRLRVCPER